MGRKYFNRRKEAVKFVAEQQTKLAVVVSRALFTFFCELKGVSGAKLKYFVRARGYYVKLLLVILINNTQLFV